ncbi:MAG: hypothetical protein ACRCZI_11475 [Cetobacterium sp.]
MDLKNKYNDGVVKKNLDYIADLAANVFKPVSGIGRLYSMEDWLEVPPEVWEDVPLTVEYSHKKGDTDVYTIRGFRGGVVTVAVGLGERLRDGNGRVRLERLV